MAIGRTRVEARVGGERVIVRRLRPPPGATVLQEADDRGAQRGRRDPTIGVDETMSAR